MALPLNLFHNTGIATLIWVLNNKKPPHRKGKMQFIDASQWFRPLRKNLGKNNCKLSREDIRRSSNPTWSTYRGHDTRKRKYVK